jgi:hypothetical protein
MRNGVYVFHAILTTKGYGLGVGEQFDPIINLGPKVKYYKKKRSSL